jgi:hypothetical protein
MKQLKFNPFIFIFTNGQVYQQLTIFAKFTQKKRFYFFCAVDFFSNKVWETLDAPNLYLTLLRFERRYKVKAVIKEGIVGLVMNQMFTHKVK